MNRREDAKAAALWAFIERVREEPGAAVDGVGGLTPADLEQLVGLLHTAVDVRRAMDERDTQQAPEATGTAAERVRAAIAACAPETAAAGHAVRRSPFSLRLPVFLHRPLAAGLAVLVLGTVFAAGRHWPAESGGHVVLAPLPGTPVAWNCATVRRHFAQLTAGRLPEREEQTMLAHMARCKHCLDAYHEYQREHPHPAPDRADAEPVVIARR